MRTKPESSRKQKIGIPATRKIYSDMSRPEFRKIPKSIDVRMAYNDVDDLESVEDIAELDSLEDIRNAGMYLEERGILSSNEFWNYLEKPWHWEETLAEQRGEHLEEIDKRFETLQIQVKDKKLTPTLSLLKERIDDLHIKLER